MKGKRKNALSARHAGGPLSNVLFLGKSKEEMVGTRRSNHRGGETVDLSGGTALSTSRSEDTPRPAFSEGEGHQESEEELSSDADPLSSDSFDVLNDRIIELQSSLPNKSGKQDEETVVSAPQPPGSASKRKREKDNHNTGATKTLRVDDSASDVVTASSTPQDDALDAAGSAPSATVPADLLQLAAQAQLQLVAPTAAATATASTPTGQPAHMFLKKGEGLPDKCAVEGFAQAERVFATPNGRWLAFLAVHGMDAAPTGQPIAINGRVLKIYVGNSKNAENITAMFDAARATGHLLKYRGVVSVREGDANYMPPGTELQQGDTIVSLFAQSGFSLQDTGITYPVFKQNDPYMSLTSMSKAMLRVLAWFHDTGGKLVLNGLLNNDTDTLTKVEVTDPTVVAALLAHLSTTPDDHFPYVLTNMIGNGATRWVNSFDPNRGRYPNPTVEFLSQEDGAALVARLNAL
jgi:hypothetical protein